MNHGNKIDILKNTLGSHGAKMRILTPSLIAFILGNCAVSDQNPDEPHPRIQQSALQMPFQPLDDILTRKSPKIGESFYPKMQSSLEKANQESQGHVDDNNVVIEE